MKRCCGWISLIRSLNKVLRWERGAVLPMFAMYSFVLVTISAVAVNLIFVGHAVIEHRSAVESFTLAAAKLALDPEATESCYDEPSELAFINCVFSKAEIAGKGKAVADALISAGNGLAVVACGSICTNGSGNTDGGKDDFSGGPYISPDPNRQAVFGIYTKLPNGTWHFAPAQLNQIIPGDNNPSKPNALKMRAILTLNDIASVGPMTAVLNRSGVPLPITFRSYAIAYRSSPSSPFQLAIDPEVATYSSTNQSVDP